eukprot:tig00021494_g21923.t1
MIIQPAGIHSPLNRRQAGRRIAAAAHGERIEDTTDFTYEDFEDEEDWRTEMLREQSLADSRQEQPRTPEQAPRRAFAGRASPPALADLDEEEVDWHVAAQRECEWWESLEAATISREAHERCADGAALGEVVVEEEEAGAWDVDETGAPAAERRPSSSSDEGEEGAGAEPSFVAACMGRLWEAAARGAAAMSKESYLQLHEGLMRCLRTSALEPAASRAVAEKDWLADADRRAVLGRHAFARSILALVRNCVATEAPGPVSAFLTAIVEALTRPPSPARAAAAGGGPGGGGGPARAGGGAPRARGRRGWLKTGELGLTLRRFAASNATRLAAGLPLPSRQPGRRPRNPSLPLF